MVLIGEKKDGYVVRQAICGDENVVGVYGTDPEDARRAPSVYVCSILAGEIGRDFQIRAAAGA